MSASTVAARGDETPSMATRLVDAARHAAHVPHHTGSMTALAQEAVTDGLDAAKRTTRAIQRGIEKLEDEGHYYVRRHPLKTVGLAVGVGVCIGMATGWIAGRLCSERPEGGRDAGHPA